MTTPPVPSVVRRLFGDHEPQLVWTNERGGLTFRAGNRFVKWNPHATGLDLEQERIRLEWAIRWHPVPKVLDWGADDEAQWLVTAALPGNGAVMESWRLRPLDAVRAIARGLRMLHDTLPVTDCPFMPAYLLTQGQADQVAREWLESWNSHDLDRLMGHYNEQIEFVSPFVVKLLNDPTGTVRGKKALREYFSKGLAKYPDLTFYLYKVCPGVRSVTIYYESVNDLMASETMELDGQGLIARVLAHYAPK